MIRYYENLSLWNARIYMHTYTCTRIFAHVYIHTYICTRIYAHIYMQKIRVVGSRIQWNTHSERETRLKISLCCTTEVSMASDALFREVDGHILKFGRCFVWKYEKKTFMDLNVTL